MITHCTGCRGPSWCCSPVCAKRTLWATPGSRRRRQGCVSARLQSCTVYSTLQQPSAKLLEYRDSACKHNGDALQQAKAAEHDAGTDSWLAHSDAAPQLARQVQELVHEGISWDNAIAGTRADISKAVRLDLWRKLSGMRMLARTPAGHAKLIAENYVKRGEWVDQLLKLEAMHPKPDDLEAKWVEAMNYWSGHMLRNTQALASSDYRRGKSIAPNSLRHARCDACFAKPAGQAMLRDLAQRGVGCLDGFADPVAVRSLHNWAISLYQRGDFWSDTNPCNTGSFHLVLNFSTSAPGHPPQYDAPAPGIPPDAADVLTQLLGVPASIEAAMDFPLRMQGALKFGVYPAGGPHYSRHLDKYDYEGMNMRSLTCLLYTDEDWESQYEARCAAGKPDGALPAGALRVYMRKDNEEAALNFRPIANRLVCFWSRTIWHEVLPSPLGSKPRLAVTLWVYSGGDWKPSCRDHPCQTAAQQKSPRIETKKPACSIILILRDVLQASNML